LRAVGTDGSVFKSQTERKQESQMMINLPDLLAAGLIEAGEGIVRTLCNMVLCNIQTLQSVNTPDAFCPLRNHPFVYA